jgi:hypothetical protein
MKKYIIKRPTTANPSIWEWKTYKKENTTVLAPVEYNTEAEANAAIAEWAPGVGQIKEVNVPDA